ncbi:MAG: GAF domain-containing protein, partial [Halanaerobium sp.]|nr:GAF domain-containing protein [Halanaerobium sp.]
ARKMETDDKEKFYQVMERLMEAQVAYEDDWLAQLANAAALLGHQLDEINWVGFYLEKQGELVLGPFQGKPACTHIPIGEGVCGTAAARKETLVIADVHDFPGHIACDEASRSEIVIPLLDEEGEVRGVLDIDSPGKGRFTEEDREGLVRLAKLIARHVDWNRVC